MQKKTRPAGLISALENRRVVVLGDLVADEYIYGLTSRLSREAPVIVVRYIDDALRLGGSANAAHNVRALGGAAIAVGVLGRDAAGDRMVRLMTRLGIETRGVVRVRRATTVKTRILAGALHTTKQQVLRLDREDDAPLGPREEAALLAKLAREMKRADALLVSDYGLGVLSAALIDAVRAYAKAGKIVCVDSRYNLLAYRGVSALTPNEPEAAGAVGADISTDERVVTAGRRLLKRLDSQAVLITRGRRGMALFSPRQKPDLIPVSGADEVADVTGAGDTVIATFTLALAAGADFARAARLANAAAGISVMKAGAATVSPQELRQVWRDPR